MIDFDPAPTLGRMWRESEPPDLAGRDGAPIDRARRSVRLTRAAMVLVPLTSIAVVVEALAHAANARERALGAFAIIGTALTWAVFVRSRHREQAALGASTPRFLAAEVRRCETDQRVAIAVWLTLACELAFLIPWWLGGLPIHSRAMISGVVARTMWVPAALMLVVACWSVRLWVCAWRERRRFRQAAAAFENEPA